MTDQEKLQAVEDRVKRWVPDDEPDAYYAMRDIEKILGLPRKP